LPYFHCQIKAHRLIIILTYFSCFSNNGKINVDHINPTPVNTIFSVKATLIAIEGRKLRYSVEAFNEKCKIGFGIYEQHVINLDNFLNKQ
jgi:predicted thioesterase